MLVTIASPIPATYHHLYLHSRFQLALCDFSAKIRSSCGTYWKNVCDWLATTELLRQGLSDSYTKHFQHLRVRFVNSGVLDLRAGPFSLTPITGGCTCSAKLSCRLRCVFGIQVYQGVTNLAALITARRAHDRRHKPMEADRGNFKIVTEWGRYEIHIYKTMD